VTLPPRPAPVVRVSDPRVPPAVAEPEPREDGPDRPPGRRRRAALLLAVSLVALAGLVELRSAQRDRSGSAELALELAVPGSTYVSAGSNRADRVLLRDVALRNAGGRPVTVLGTELVGGALSSRGGPVLPPGSGAGVVVLAGAVRCADGRPPFAPPGSVLRVRAATGAGERSVDLPVPPEVLAGLQAAAERVCSLRPASREVQVRQVRGAVEGGRLLLDLELGGTAAAPVDVVRARPALPGLRVTVERAGRPAALPLRLATPDAPPGGRAGTPTSPLRLAVGVASCPVLRRALGGSVEVLDTALLVDLVLRVEGEPEETVRSVADDGGLPRLLASAC